MRQPTVVIVGAGFGGIHAAKELREAPMKVVLLDRNNYHLFQPLLYQVAMALLPPTEIAYPVRAITLIWTAGVRAECVMDRLGLQQARQGGIQCKCPATQRSL